MHAVWEEEVQVQVGMQGKLSDKDKEQTGIKVLVQLLVKWGKALDTLAGEPVDLEIGDDVRDEEDAANRMSQCTNRQKEVIALIRAEDHRQVALAIDVLWEEFEIVSQWEELLES